MGNQRIALSTTSKNRRRSARSGYSFLGCGPLQSNSVAGVAGVRRRSAGLRIIRRTTIPDTELDPGPQSTTALQGFRYPEGPHTALVPAQCGKDAVPYPRWPPCAQPGLERTRSTDYEAEHTVAHHGSQCLDHIFILLSSVHTRPSAPLPLHPSAKDRGHKGTNALNWSRSAVSMLRTSGSGAS